MLSTLKALRPMPSYMGHLHILDLRLERSERSTTLDQLPRLRIRSEGQNMHLPIAKMYQLQRSASLDKIPKNVKPTDIVIMYVQTFTPQPVLLMHIPLA